MYMQYHIMITFRIKILFIVVLLFFLSSCTDKPSSPFIYTSIQGSLFDGKNQIIVLDNDTLYSGRKAITSSDYSLSYTVPSRSDLKDLEIALSNLKFIENNSFIGSRKNYDLDSYDLYFKFEGDQKGIILMADTIPPKIYSFYKILEKVNNNLTKVKFNRLERNKIILHELKSDSGNIISFDTSNKINALLRLIWQKIYTEKLSEFKSGNLRELDVYQVPFSYYPNSKYKEIKNIFINPKNGDIFVKILNEQREVIYQIHCLSCETLLDAI